MMQRLFANCEHCLSKPGSSNEDTVRGTGGASEESDDINDLHDNNDRESDVHDSERSDDED